MSFPNWSAPVRLLFLGFLALNLTALLLGTIAPRAAAGRRPVLERYAVIDPVHFRGGAAPGLDLLELSSGSPVRLELHPGEVFDCATVAPFREADGTIAAVGRWRRITGRTAGVRAVETALARVSIPDGGVLALIETEVLPISAPVRLPGAGNRWAYVAGDGHLYWFDFDQPDQSVRALALPGHLGDTFFRELSRPEDPALAEFLLASAYHPDPDDPRRLTQSRAWWLRLSPGSDAIRAAGPLLTPDPTPDDHAPSERWPAAISRPDGSLALTYHWQCHDLIDSELRIVPLEFDRVNHVLMAHRDRARVLAADVLPNAVAVSHDGHWTAAVTGGGTPRLRRLEVPAAE